MAKKEGFSLTRSFVKHFLRGGLKGTGDVAEALINPAKWVSIVTGILDEMIFGILDEKAANKESKKVHEKFDRLLEIQAKGLEAQETDFAEVLLWLHQQVDFNEKVEAELKKIVSFLEDPDKAEVPEKFADAVNKILAGDEKLRETVLEGVAKLSKDHTTLSRKIDLKTQEIKKSIISGINESYGEILKELHIIRYKMDLPVIVKGANQTEENQQYRDLAVTNATRKRKGVDIKGDMVPVTITIDKDRIKFTEADEHDLLRTICRKLRLGKDKVLIRGVREGGSVIVTLEIPQYSTGALIDLYLAADHELRNIGIRKVCGIVPVEKKDVKRNISVCLSKLPSVSSQILGRGEEILMLDSMWIDIKTKIVILVAWGGVGKTALVNKWLLEMSRDRYRGAERVYGWSFYSQGTKEDRQASSDTFLANALEWFGDKETAKSAKSPWDKGVRLAELVREQKTLLILDGVEPLQYPPGPMQGRLKDQGLQGLLRELSHGMDGLCIITTREDIKDLEHCVGHTVKRVELENLSPEAGMQVLRVAGVTEGTDKELMETSEKFGGHALSLDLLGKYLSVAYEGDIRNIDKIKEIAYQSEGRGRHAKRLLESYEGWLNKRELGILYMMGLFDRPAQAGAIEKLQAKPAIVGLTENIVSLSEAEWRYAVTNLRGLGLLAKDGEGQPDDLDCHPLVREHFGEKLKEEKPEAWREAHNRLYEYYKGVPEKEYPDTLEEMEPLFQAVYHGCAAGRYQETLDDVYWRRIKRGNEHYSTRLLGAFGSDLGALACFFERRWDRPAAGLSEHIKALVLNFAGFALRAVGRLREAAEPMEAGLKLQAEQADWGNVARATNNLSELYLTSGYVQKAIDYGHRCIEYADKSGDAFGRMSNRATLADALFQAGEIEEANWLLEEAEQIQKAFQQGYPYLYAVWGYRYCDLLLALGKYEEVKRRARQTLEWGKGQYSLLDIALDKLSLGRAGLEEIKIKNQKLKSKIAEEDLINAKRWLDEAVDGLRKAGTQDHLPLGLLARAGYYRFQRRWDKAWGDLEEALEIAERGEMKLYLADYHLESARVCLDEGRKGDAKGHYEEARRLVEECGYHRRDEELKELERGIS